MSVSSEPTFESERLFRREEYQRLGELGFFDEERVELLYGKIITKSPKGPDHEWSLQRLTKLLIVTLLDQAAVRVQLSFVAGDFSQPEPDVAIVPVADYSKAHPSKAFLIIEVARSSLKQDRGIKAKLYAESGVPEYWVVNLVDGLVEVRSDIVSGGYASLVPYRKGQRITLPGFPDVSIAAEDIL